jgi:hypothetical protein
MPLISRLDKTVYPHDRTTGIYGHWPIRKYGYPGYIRILTKKHGYTFWYGLRNKYRPGKIIERFPRRPFTSNFELVRPGLIRYIGERNDQNGI